MTDPHPLTFQVPENPDYDPLVVADAARQHRIIVPWSGGLDSTTLAVQAVQTGAPVLLVSFTSGQPWDSGEARARTFIKERTPELAPLQHVHVHLDPAPAVFHHVQVGRNQKMIEWCAEYTEGMRGYEVWLGWLDGETLPAGGDKSHHLLAYLQEAHPRLNLQLPYRLLTKPDLVRWWLDEKRIEQAAHLYSCFTGGTVPCGRCQACFRFWAAFAALGVHDVIPWRGRVMFDAQVAKYERKAYVSSRRRRQDHEAIRVYRDLTS